LKVGIRRKFGLNVIWRLSICRLGFSRQTKWWSGQLFKSVPQRQSRSRLNSYWRKRCWYWTAAG